MGMRAIAFVIIGLMLGGCMQETIEPASQAGWTARDKELMANLPYAQAEIPGAISPAHRRLYAQGSARQHRRR